MARGMIRNFSDHAANERTFLAWVRTAIAVMAFGFLVEKFDLFLEITAPSLAGRSLSLSSQRYGNIAGLALIVLGTAMDCRRRHPLHGDGKKHR
jgi:putative membrane protein